MFTITINLAKVHGAYVANDANGQGVVCIPTSMLFAPPPSEGKPQGVYLSLDVWTHAPNQWDYTRTVRQHVENFIYDKMTEAERKALPVIGRGK